jgi:hypothetical protein
MASSSLKTGISFIIPIISHLEELSDDLKWSCNCNKCGICKFIHILKANKDKIFYITLTNSCKYGFMISFHNYKKLSKYMSDKIDSRLISILYYTFKSEKDKSNVNNGMTKIDLDEHKLKIEWNIYRNGTSIMYKISIEH